MTELEQNLERSGRANLNLVEPNFNDERTIQTARPVVPLNPFLRILTRRHLVFTGAFVLAALLGAGTALAIIKLRQPVSPNPSQALEKGGRDQQPVAEVTDAEGVNQTSADSASTVDEETTMVPTDNPTKSLRQTRAVQHPSRSTPKVTVSVKTNDSQPQARLVDEWQEKRQRRVARPERQNNHYKRDLFRIREIFEGPRPE
jgi:hypothetical protein